MAWASTDYIWTFDTYASQVSADANGVPFTKDATAQTEVSTANEVTLKYFQGGATESYIYGAYASTEVFGTATATSYIYMGGAGGAGSRSFLIDYPFTGSAILTVAYKSNGGNYLSVFDNAAKSKELASVALTKSSSYAEYSVEIPDLNNTKLLFTTSSKSEILAVKLTVNEAYSYTVVPKAGGTALGENLASGVFAEGSNPIQVWYPFGYRSGNTLHYKNMNGSNPRYAVTFTPNANNFEQVVNYDQSVNNVFYYSEVEKVSGAISATNSAYAAGGQMGRFIDGQYHALKTLTPGKYKIYGRAHCGNGSGTYTYSFKAGDAEVLSGTLTNNGLNQNIESSEFIVTENTELSLQHVGGSGTGIDYVYVQYIEGLNIVTQPVASATGYFSGVAAEPLSVTAASYGKTLTYQWYKNTTNSATGGSAFSSSASCVPETTSAGTTYYYCVVSDGTNNVTTDVVKVVVAATARLIKSSVAEGEGSVKLMYASDEREFPSGSYIEDGTSIKVLAIPADGYKFTQWSIGSTSSNNPFTYTVADRKTYAAKFAVLAQPTITTQPANVECEQDGNATMSVVADKAEDNATYHSTLSYQWYWSYNTDGSAATPIEGASAQTATCTLPTDGTGTIYVYCIVTETQDPANPSAKGSSSSMSNIATLTITGGKAKTNIYAYLTATEEQANESNCTLEFYNKNNQKQTLPQGEECKDSQNNTYYQKTFGDAASYFKVIPTGCTFEVGDEITVYIYANSNSGCGYKLSSSSSTSISYPSSFTKGSVYPISHTLVAADIESDGSLKIFRSSSNDYFAGFSATLKRDPAAPTIKTQPAGGEICIDDKHEMTIEASGAPAPTYQWYSNTTNSNEGGTAIEGATEDTYTWQTTEEVAAGNYYFYCLVSNSAGSVKSNVATVNVSKKAAVISVKDSEDKSVSATTVYVADMGTLNVSSTSSAAISVTNSNGAVATVSFVDGVLYIVANKAGSTTVTLSQGENTTSLAADNKTIDVTVKKHTLNLALKSGSDTSYEHNNTTGNTTGSYASLALSATDESGNAVSVEGLDVIYVSDDASIVAVSKNANNQPTLAPSTGQGTAHIIAAVEENDFYEHAKAVFSYKISSGFRKQIEETVSSGNKPLYNTTQEIKSGENLLLTVRMGGYKYSSTTSTTKYNDTWGNVQKYTGPGGSKIKYVDDVELSSQADNNARSENVTESADKYNYDGRAEWYTSSEKNADGVPYSEFERIKPFSLPCRGAYMKFEPEQNGVLSVYVLQNGNLNFKNEQENRLWYDGEMSGSSPQTPLAGAPRIYYWFDQDGYRIDPVSVTVKQPLTIGRLGDETEPSTGTEKHNIWQSKRDLETTLGNWIAADADLEVLLTSWGDQDEIDANLAKANPTPQRIIEYKGGYTLLQKAYVKYVIKVVAGRSYYFFSNSSKLGYAGANFEPSTETNQAVELVKPGGGTLTASVSSTLVELAQSDDAIVKMRPRPESETIDGYETVTLARTFKVNTWNTICLPFHVTEKQVEKVFGTGTKLMIYNGLEGTKAHFLQHVDQNILAGQPYFIYPTGTGATVTDEKVGDENGKITFHNVCVDPTLAVKSYGNNKFETEPEANYEFIGTLAQESVVKGSYYVNATTGVLTRYAGDSPTTLNTYRAYLKPTAGNQNLAKISSISFTSFEEDSDIITGLEEYLVNEMGVEIAPVKGVFNLVGQKVADSTKGLPAGIYIVNGKTITIK